MQPTSLVKLGGAAWSMSTRVDAPGLALTLGRSLALLRRRALASDTVGKLCHTPSVTNGNVTVDGSTGNITLRGNMTIIEDW